MQASDEFVALRPHLQTVFTDRWQQQSGARRARQRATVVLKTVEAVLELRVHGTTDRYVVTGPQVLIGRGPHCNIHIMSPDVSREHAVIKRVGVERYIIEDRGSSNGTWLGNQPIGRRQLVDGDVYRFGGVKVSVSLRPRYAHGRYIGA